MPHMPAASGHFFTEGLATNLKPCIHFILKQGRPSPSQPLLITHNAKLWTRACLPAPRGDILAEVADGEFFPHPISVFSRAKQVECTGSRCPAPGGEGTVFMPEICFLSEACSFAHKSSWPSLFAFNPRKRKMIFACAHAHSHVVGVQFHFALMISSSGGS